MSSLADPLASRQVPGGDASAPLNTPEPRHSADSGPSKVRSRHLPRPRFRVLLYAFYTRPVS
jgi:hypothetical protein